MTKETLSLLCYPAVALMLAFSSVSAFGATLLNDTFDNGSIGPQDLPTSAQWYGSGSSNVTATTGSMTLSTLGGTTSGMVTGYFTDSGTVSVGVGETLTATFVFTMSGIDSSVGYFRFGLFDSGGTRLTAQNQGISNSIYNNYTGYATLTNISSNNNNLSLNKRDVLPNNGLLSTGAAYTILDTSGSPYKLENGVTYTSTLSLFNTGSGMELTQSLTGGSLSNVTLTRTDPSSIYTTFDTFAVAIQSSTATTLTFDSINISLVPEPGSASLMLTALLGAAAVRRVRRRAAIG